MPNFIRAAAVLLVIAFLPWQARAADSNHQCLMFAARNIATGNANFYIYCTFARKKIAIAKGDALEYQVFLDPSNPLPQGGIDIDTENGDLRDTHTADLDGVDTHGAANIPEAVGTWHRRHVSLDALAGETTRDFTAVFEGDAPGMYVQFIDNVVIIHADGKKTKIYSGEEPPKDFKARQEGYSKEVLFKPVLRSSVKKDADLSQLYIHETKNMELESQLESLRAQAELVRKVADLEHNPKLTASVAAAKEAYDNVAKKETLDADSVKKVGEQVHSALASAHPIMQTYTGYLIGHAHIDFQWLWPWTETIQICHDTFGQALKFIDEFPGFKFTQSSAGLYAATEQNWPDIFKGIQKQVAAGNWEIVGGRICEGDEHMISPESHARHFLYGQRYFRERFNGKCAVVGWEPDTFGHTWQMPQILQRGGCKYLYFCRGGHGDPLFWWEAPDGTRVMAFDQQACGDWYDGNVTPDHFDHIMEYAAKSGSKDMPWAYGVGNHGGGPTREYINAALDFQKSDTLPRVKFATAQETFEQIASHDLSKLAVFRTDINTPSSAGFYGTYTTHSDEKRWNRQAEAMTESAEAIAAMASRYGFEYPGKEFRRNWEDICWAHHHDTISGTTIHNNYDKCETLFKRIFESDRNIGDEALTLLATKIKGEQNSVVVFNPCAFERDGIVEVEDGDATVAVSDKESASIQKTVDGKSMFYATKLPSLGYRTYKLESRNGDSSSDLKVSNDGTTLESAKYKVVIDPAHGVVSQIIDKSTNRNAIAAGGSGNRLEIHWESPNSMSAWVIGKVNTIQPLVDPVAIKVSEKGPMRVAVEFDRKFQSTILHQVISLATSGPPVFEMSTKWKELGTNKAPFPSLRVAFDLAVDKPKFTAQIPFGNIEKPTDGGEIPALTFCDLADENGGAALMNDCKYGYSATGNILRLSLIRSSYNPDPHPNDRPQMARWSLIPHKGNWRDAGVLQTAQAFNHPLWSAPLKPAADASLPAEMSFLSLDQGNVIVTGVKKAEDDNDLIVRFYEAYGKPTTAALKLPWTISATKKVNFIEDVSADQTNPGELRGYQIQTLKLKTN